MWRSRANGWGRSMRATRLRPPAARAGLATGGAEGGGGGGGVGAPTPPELGAAPTSSSAAQKARARRTWMVLGLPIALTTGLGFWQVYRLNRKLELIESRRSAIQMPLLRAIPSPFDDSTQFRRVRVRGRYRPEDELYVGPRSTPDSLPGRLYPDIGSVGYNVITPLQQDDGTVLLVNRGWVPMYPKSFHVMDAPPQGEVFVHGVIREPDVAKRWTPANVPERNQWFWMDVKSMLQHFGLSGVNAYVEELGDPSAHQEILPWPKRPDDHLNFSVAPVTHVTYAVTWFTLAIFMTYMVYARNYGRWGRMSRRFDEIYAQSSSSSSHTPTVKPPADASAARASKTPTT